MYPGGDPTHGEDVTYYLSLYNENYQMPAMPAGVGAGVLEGLYRWCAAPEVTGPQATVLFSGPMWAAATVARTTLAERYGVGVELWSATSYSELRREALQVERWNRLHPTAAARVPLVTARLGTSHGPIVAVTDYMRAVPDQISRWVPRSWMSLGTDGFGRSDTREALRRFFEVDGAHVVIAVLSQLAAEGQVPAEWVTDAITQSGVDPEAAPPWHG